MSHLNHQVCGVDYFISYSKASKQASDLVEYLKSFFKKNKITYYSIDLIEFNHNYFQTLQVQSMRCKIFLYIIDKFSLECNWFLCNFIYAQSHNRIHSLPILLPIILFDKELTNYTDLSFSCDATNVNYEKIININNSNTGLLLKFDLTAKQKLASYITKDCVTSIELMQMDSYEKLIKNLKEITIDLIPIGDGDNSEYDDLKEQDNQFFIRKNRQESKKNLRFDDRFRPLTREEENFLSEVQSSEIEKMKKFEITNYNMRLKLKNERIHVSLSVPYHELNRHISEMLSLQCHLVWLDVIAANNLNYFNFIWEKNNEDTSDDNKKDKNNHRTFEARPPSYMIFYDLNTAQMARIYQQFSVEHNWNLELIDSYVKVEKPNGNYHVSFKETLNRAKSARLRKITTNNQMSSSTANPTRINSTIKSNEDIFYICQFKNLSNKINSTNKEEIINKLQHSIIDHRLNECFNNMVKFTYEQNYIPIKLTPIVMNVNTVNNKHFYYSIIYKPVPKPNNKDDDHFNHENFEKNMKYASSNYFVQRGMIDSELLEFFNFFVSKGWKLIDLKAYKDENSVTKFCAIVSNLDINEFYEGSFKLFLGLNKQELVNKIDEMKKKGLHPKILTNYGYLMNKNQEHVYAVFFCQY